MKMNKITINLKKSSSGFTLIEVMITVAVIGIISAIAWSSYDSQMLKSNRSDAVVALTSARQALIAFKSDNGAFPANSGAAVTFLTTRYRPAAPNTPEPECRSERGFQALAGTAANSVLSCRGLWDIQVTSTNANSFDLTAILAPGRTDEECVELTLDNFNVRDITTNVAGTPINRCWTE